MRGHRHRFRRAQLLPPLLSVVVALSGSSCRSTPKKQSLSGPESPAQQLAEREATILQLKKEIGQQASHVVAKEAMIKQLEQWLLSQQRMLDDAMQEVVRVQAKQRSVESRAEAASQIAEAEIGLKSLRDKAVETNRPERASAEQLLGRATQEFEKQNFGGAIYLVGQAKGQIKLGELRLGEHYRAGEGEGAMLFAVPLSLTLNTKGNLREGPGQEFKVLVTLEAGTRITGYFTKGAWLRVESEGGWSGWIRRSQVSPN